MELWLLSFLATLVVVNAGLITSLPGAPNAAFKQYAGYFDVGVKHHLHYWFAESQSNPSTDPVVLWLTGGPGCSSLSALLNEIGPWTVQEDGVTLQLNPYAWNRKASLLFLESPAGVGYSYAEDGNVTTNDEQVSIENRQALVAFFTQFSQYRNNDFYVTGESYAGIYVPTLVQKILDLQGEFRINIKGLAIGNGEVSYDLDTDTTMLYTYSHGIVDELTWRKVEQQCCNGALDGCPFHSFEGYGFCPIFVEETVNTVWYGGFNPYNIFADCSHEGNPDIEAQTRFYHEAKFRTGKLPPIHFKYTPCLNETAATLYLNQPGVRTALFVPSSLPKWDMCNGPLGDLYGRLYFDMSSRIRNAVSAGLRVLIYNGDGDLACNYLMGQRFTQRLGYACTSPMKWFNVDGQVAGFHTQYGNVEFVVVRGAGHMVPTDKPAVGYYLLDSFLNNRRP